MSRNRKSESSYLREQQRLAEFIILKEVQYLDESSLLDRILQLEDELCCSTEFLYEVLEDNLGLTPEEISDLLFDR